MAKRIDLTGQKFGRLTVIEYSHTKSGRAYWLCKCDCGEYITVMAPSLKRGLTKSCGCLRKEHLKKMLKRGRLPEGVAACNAILRRHKKDAKRRNFEQALTDEQIIVLHKENCHYCGAPPLNVQKSRFNTGSYIYNGIDRIDNTKGYTINNVVSCCRRCNRAKDINTYNEFKDWIKQVHSYLDL